MKYACHHLLRTIARVGDVERHGKSATNLYLCGTERGATAVAIGQWEQRMGAVNDYPLHACLQ